MIYNAHVYIILYYVFYIYHVCDIIVNSKKCYKPLTITFFQLSQNLLFSIYDTFKAVSLCKPLSILYQISKPRILHLIQVCLEYQGRPTGVQKEL